MLKKLDLQTNARQELHEITHQVKQLIEDSQISEGICLVYIPHTTAGLVINSFRDPATLLDLNEEISRLVPTRIDFHHIFDTPTDASGHIKSSLTSVNISLIVDQGKPLLGESQGIFFWEFDGPRQRTVYVKIIQG